LGHRDPDRSPTSGSEPGPDPPFLAAEHDPGDPVEVIATNPDDRSPRRAAGRHALAQAVDPLDHRKTGDADPARRGAGGPGVLAWARLAAPARGRSDR